MKKILLSILLLTASTLIYSQSMDLNHKKIHIVDSTMGLGITPTSRLHVFGNGTSSNLFNVTNDKDATKDSSGVIDAVGNVGIGTTTPTQQLEITKNFKLPNTTDTSGVIYMDTSRFLHCYNNNLFLGKLSGNFTTGSHYNVGIGDNVLDSTTSGSNNSIVGINALIRNTIGDGNSGIGCNLFYNNKAGDYNSFIGEYGMYNNISGDRNSGVGGLGLFNNLSGNSNSGIGERFLYNNSSGNNNIGIGSYAGCYGDLSNRLYINSFNRLNLLGDTTESIIYGLQNSLRSLQHLYLNANVHIPENLYLDTTTHANLKGIIYKGSEIIFHDFNYGNDGVVTTIGGNLFLGINSGNFTMGATAPLNFLASTNIGIGPYTLSNLTTGFSNIAIGADVLYENTTGNANTGVGVYSLFANTTGVSNTALGSSALRYNRVGAYNVGIGADALTLADSTIYNTAIGTGALENDFTGSWNTAGGDYSMGWNVSGHYNTAFGHGSMTNNVSGNSNLSFGSFSGRYSTDLSNRLYINSLDRINIQGDTTKSIIYGLQDADESLQKLWLNANTIIPYNLAVDGRIGIGTRNPAAALHVQGAEQIGNVNTLIEDSVNALRLSGTATVWDDLMFPFSTGHQGNANYPPFNADSLYFEFGIDSTGADAQFMYFIIQMPHSWKEGSKIYPHVHYKYETAVGACSFKMKYKWYNIGASTEIGWNWANMNISTGSTDKTHIMASTYSGINGSGKTISSILICKVYLYGVAGTGTCKAWQFDIHYEKDSMGSNSETSKN